MDETLKRVDSFFSSIIDPAYVLDLEGRIVKTNDTALVTFADVKEGAAFDVLGRSLCWSNGEDCFYRCLANRETVYHQVKDDLGRSLFELTFVPLCLASESPEGVLLSVTNLVGESLIEERYRVLNGVMDSILDGVITLDLKHRITGMNQSAVQLLKIQEGQAKLKNVNHILRFKLTDDMNAFADAVKHRISKDINAELYSFEGKALHCLISISCLREAEDQVNGFVVVLKDRSAQVELEQRLLQMEKMNSLGSLVAGFAHELNNPLTSVVGFSQLLLATPEAEKKYQEELKIINENAMRCKKIIDNLLLFARKRPSVKKASDINATLNTSFELMGYQLRRNGIKVSMDLDKDLPKAFADPYQIQQVLVNLIENARYEMTRIQKKGTIKAATFHEDEWVVIKIADSGEGVSEEDMDRIYTPFYTTKPPDMGTGLGLSLSKGIIKDHMGALSVRNLKEGGAEFTVRLPKCVDFALAEETKKSGDKAIERTVSCSSGKKILVVDDEDSVCVLVQNLLAHQGIIVEAARDHKEALEKLQNNRFDLLLLDLRLPGMDGFELKETIYNEWPEYENRFLFMTGDSLEEDGNDLNPRFSELDHVINKPFSIQQLTTQVSYMLDLNLEQSASFS